MSCMAVLELLEATIFAIIFHFLSFIAIFQFFEKKISSSNLKKIRIFLPPSTNRINWLLGAIKNCNPMLKTSSTLNCISLGCITRIDISHNAITTLPDELFAMCSLRYLNAAQNKIEQLPPVERCTYRCPVLEEIYLQDNSLAEILPEIFRLPSLVILDISNNKLQRIPFDMWKATKLRELNIAFNLLKDLPTSEENNASTMYEYRSTELTSMTRAP